jgi:hypothetical protein
MEFKVQLALIRARIARRIASGSIGHAAMILAKSVNESRPAGLEQI